MGFIYLASPYWHESELIRLQRVNLVRKAAAELMEKGFCIYSPISHCVDISKHIAAANRHSHDFWMAQDLPILSQAKALWVLTLNGWRDSKGIQAEILHAQSNSIPITYITEQFPGEVRANLTNRPNPDFSQSAAEGVRPGSAPAIGG